MPREKDPTGRQPHDPGAKLDQGKPRAGLLCSFGKALLAVAEVATFGANKYTQDGWEEVPNGQARYTDALLRHLLIERTEPVDPETHLPHAAHVAWNALARLELLLRTPPKPSSPSVPLTTTNGKVHPR